VNNSTRQSIPISAREASSGICELNQTESAECETETKNRADERKQNSFRGELPREPADICASALRMAISRRRASAASEKQIGDIDARNQQNESDGAEEHQKRWPHT